MQSQYISRKINTVDAVTNLLHKIIAIGYEKIIAMQFSHELVVLDNLPPIEIEERVTIMQDYPYPHPLSLFCGCQTKKNLMVASNFFILR